VEEAPPAPAARPIESVLEEIEMARATARGLVAESKIWEALDCLAKARALAEGTSEERSLRILTWETQAKLPSLMRQAHQNLEDFAREQPADAAVHSALGRLYWEAGLSARARVAFKQVLTLDPQNREALAALGALGDPGKPR
jgi:cytochrome c-type biogenesis protein CcmH/NrfG